jgi:hypothetical protein
MGFTFIANGFPILIYLSSDFCPDPLCSSYTCNTHAWPRAVLVLYGDYSGSRHARPITYRQAAVLVIGREPMHFHASQQAQAGQGPRAPHIVLARTRRGQLAFQVGAGGEGDMRHAAAPCGLRRKSESPWQRAGRQARAAAEWRGWRSHQVWTGSSTGRPGSQLRLPYPRWSCQAGACIPPSTRPWSLSRSCAYLQLLP